MRKKRRAPRFVARFGFGVAIALFAVAVQLPLGLWLAHDSYQLFLAAVAVSAIRAGKSNAGITVAVSVACKWILFFVPAYPGYGETALFVDRMVTFLSMGGALCWLGGALHDADQRERELLARARLLRGLLPICSSCKRIRDDRGHWCEVEGYIAMHSDAEFSHGFCPRCAARVEQDAH